MKGGENKKPQLVDICYEQEKVLNHSNEDKWYSQNFTEINWKLFKKKKKGLGKHTLHRSAAKIWYTWSKQSLLEI